MIVYHIYKVYLVYKKRKENGNIRRIQLGTRITLQVSEGGCDDCFFAKLDYDLRVIAATA